MNLQKSKAFDLKMGGESLPYCFMKTTQTIMHPAVNRLSIQNFRNVEHADMDCKGAKFIVLSGPNGAGKTNLLEAVSLLAPGRGLRRARLQDMMRLNSQQPFTIYSQFQSQFGQIDLGIGMDQEKNKKICKINGMAQKSQGDLGEYVAAVWLTPQMDRLFQEGASARRRFFDRLVASVDPAHGGRMQAYEHAMRSRMKLLVENPHFNGQLGLWLDGLEREMVERASAITAARLALIQRLNQACGIKYEGFPPVSLSIEGGLEGYFHQQSGAKVEADYQQRLKDERIIDQQSNTTQTGPHKSDLNAIHVEKNMPASLCSTGEQKALLISIILADLSSKTSQNGHVPLLILDEITAHLDEGRRESLFEILGQQPGQIWLSGADSNLFQSLGNSHKNISYPNHHFHIEAGMIYKKE